MKINLQIWSLSFAPWWKVDDLDHDERSTVLHGTGGRDKMLKLKLDAVPSHMLEKDL